MQRKIDGNPYTHQNNQLNCHPSLERGNSKDKISFNVKCNVSKCNVKLMEILLPTKIIN